MTPENSPSPTPTYEVQKDKSLNEDERGLLNQVNANADVLQKIIDNPNKDGLSEKEKKVMNAYNAIKDRIRTVNQTNKNENKTESSSLTYEKPNNLTTVQTTEKKSEAKSELKNIGQDNGIVESMDNESLTDVQNKINAWRSINVIGRSDANIFKDNWPNSTSVKQKHYELFTELQKDLPVKMQQTLITPKKPDGAEATEQKISDRLNEVLAQARAMQALKDIKGKIGADEFKKLVNNPTTNIITEPHKSSRSWTDRWVSVICDQKKEGIEKMPIVKSLQESEEKIKDVDHYQITIPVQVKYKTDDGKLVSVWKRYEKSVVVTTESIKKTKIDENGKKTETLSIIKKEVSPLWSKTPNGKDLWSPKGGWLDYAKTMEKIDAHPATYWRSMSNITNTYGYVENNEKKTVQIQSTSNSPKSWVSFVLDPVVFSGKKDWNLVDIGNVSLDTKWLLNAQEGTWTDVQKQIEKDFPVTNSDQFNSIISKWKINWNQKPSF